MNRLRFNGVLHCFCVISKTELWKDILALKASRDIKIYVKMTDWKGLQVCLEMISIIDFVFSRSVFLIYNS